MNELLDWAKFLSPFALGVAAYYMKVDKAIKKAETAVTMEQLHQVVDKTQEKVLDEIKPIRDEVTKQGVHIEWIVKTMKNGG